MLRIISDVWDLLTGDTSVVPSSEDKYETLVSCVALGLFILVLATVL